MTVALAEIEKVSLRVARFYARRCWWADLDDLKQEARTTALLCAASPTYDPTRRFSSYAEQAIRRKLGQWLLHQAPVSAGFNNGSKLANMERAPVSDDIPAEVSDEHARTAWVAQVQKAILRALRTSLPTDTALIARDVLVGGAKPHVVARKHKIKIHAVYHALSEARTALWWDESLRRLHLEGWD